jgi:hypothetical protein
MKKILKGFAVLVVLFIGLVVAVGAMGHSAPAGGNLAATSNPQVATAPAPQAAAPQPAPASDAPRQSVTLTGNADQKTKPVELHGNYTLDYTDASDKFGGNLMIDLVPTNASYGKSLANTITEANTPYTGTTQIYNANGTYYFDVIARGDWTLTVTPL